MELHDLESSPPTIDPTPRLYPRGIRRRMVEAGEKPTFELRGSHLLAVALSGLFIAGLIILFYSFSGSKPVQPQAQPTEAPLSRVFSAPPTTPPAPPRATAVTSPTSSPVPPVAPAPAHQATGASEEAQPPIGQGLTLAEPEQAPVVDQYLENVAAQAPHSPRGDGQAGPNGGDWVAVPTITGEQAAIIQQQAPHKVR